MGAPIDLVRKKAFQEEMALFWHPPAARRRCMVGSSSFVNLSSFV